MCILLLYLSSTNVFQAVHCRLFFFLMIFDFSVYLSCYKIPAGARLGFGCASLKVLLNHHESDDKISGCDIPLCRRMGENKTCFQLTRQLTKREGTDKSDSSQQEALPGAGISAYGKHGYALVGLESSYTCVSFTASLLLSVALPNPIFLPPKQLHSIAMGTGAHPEYQKSPLLQYSSSLSTKAVPRRVPCSFGHRAQCCWLRKWL